MIPCCIASLLAIKVQAFVNSEQLTIAPSITLNLGERTNLNLYYEYLSFYADPPFVEIPLLSDDSLPPRDFFPNYPSFRIYDYVSHRVGYTLNHEFNDDWQIRNGFAVLQSRTQRLDNFFTRVEDDRLLAGFEFYDTDSQVDNYSGQLDLLGEFETGSIAHQLLVGLDFNRNILD